jgi:hypothetical protein
MKKVTWRSFLRTKENGGRRSRTLQLEDQSGQLQGKEARVEDGPRLFQVRWWAEETDAWTHLIVDPTKTGLDAISSVGTGHTEPESWEMARAAFKASRGIEL